MKKDYFLLAGFSLLTLLSFSQRNEQFSKQFDPIRKDLHQWDPVRGPWLAQSIESHANQQTIPVRNFPERVTPRQLVTTLPLDLQDRINGVVRANQTNGDTRDQWNHASAILTNTGCQPVRGRSYGDPHLESFDGAKYSFQTVGEFTLAKSTNGRVEIQARQKAQNESFSLNTAVSMNVNGDRVAIYAEDYPDNDRSTPVRINGMPVIIDQTPHELANGGIVRRSRGLYVVDWPTGESATVELRNQSLGSFMNVSFLVFPCTQGGYRGLLGNANGFSSDDYNTSRGVSPVSMVGAGMIGANADVLEKQRLKYLAQEFADEHRISQASSLFDYSIGQSTLSFTDRSFPRVHLTMNDLTNEQQDRARKHCQNNGIDAGDMDACIYDNGFLGIQPTRHHVVEDPTEGLKPVRTVNDQPNVVIPEKVREPANQGGTRDAIEKPSIGGTVRDSGTSDPGIKSNPTPRSGGSTPSTPKPSISTPRPSIPAPSPSIPRSSSPSPSTPKPSPSTPRSSGTIIKGGR